MRDKWMAPEWLACPEIPQYSIGWRMGYGEDYGYRISLWWQKLSEQERTVLKNVMKKTPAYRDSPLSRMKRR